MQRLIIDKKFFNRYGDSRTSILIIGTLGQASIDYIEFMHAYVVISCDFYIKFCYNRFLNFDISLTNGFISDIGYNFFSPAFYGLTHHVGVLVNLGFILI